MKIRIALTDPEKAACMALRREVFIHEQGVSEAEEIDGLDGACTHILAEIDGVPIGAARISYSSDAATIQRVCVAKGARGQGVGVAMTRYMLNHIELEGMVLYVRLGAQTHALGFYRKLGFAEYGAEYLDAGIPHTNMELEI